MSSSSSAFGRLPHKVRDQRWRVARWRLRTERPLLARVNKPRTRTGGRVLAYHSTGTPEWGVNDVRPAAFVEQLELALQLGYRFVPAEDVAAGRAGPADLAVTFDDGLRSIQAVVPFLQRRSIPFAIFPVVDWASGGEERFLSWTEIGNLVAEGASIGSHSMTHANFRDLSPAMRQAELEGSREAFKQRLGRPPTLFAIPFGGRRDWNPACSDLARKAGYAAVFAQAEDQRPAGTLGRSFVCRYDGLREFRAVLEGRFDSWEEWY